MGKHLANILMDSIDSNFDPRLRHYRHHRQPSCKSLSLNLVVDHGWPQPLVLSAEGCITGKPCIESVCSGTKLPRWARSLVANHSCWPLPNDTKVADAMNTWVEHGA